MSLDPSPIQRTVYLVNSTPKYYYLLPLHFALLRRYGGLKMEMDVVLATEVPDHPIVRQVAADYDVEVLTLRAEDAGFLDSRAAALAALVAQERWDYVLPMQEDFLLDRAPPLLRTGVGIGPYWHLQREEEGVASVRLMPCPGPVGPGSELTQYWDLQEGRDTYGFTFQATLWRLKDCADWYRVLCEALEKAAPRATTPHATRIQLEVRANFAENAAGQRLFWAWSTARGLRHRAYVRAGAWSNAVYLSPWPYRPTAIVKGRLEPWAREMAQREGFSLRPLNIENGQ